jgi:hypothetical protein
MSHSFLQRNSLFAPISFLSDLMHNDTVEVEVRRGMAPTPDALQTSACIRCAGNFPNVGTDGGNATRLFKNVKIKDSLFLIK